MFFGVSIGGACLRPGPVDVRVMCVCWSQYRGRMFKARTRGCASDVCLLESV